MAIHNFKGNKEMQPYDVNGRELSLFVNRFIDYCGRGQEWLAHTEASQSVERENGRLQKDQRQELIEKTWS